MKRRLELRAANISKTDTDYLTANQGAINTIQDKGRWPLVRFRLERKQNETLNSQDLQWSSCGPRFSWTIFAQCHFSGSHSRRHWKMSHWDVLFIQLSEHMDMESVSIMFCSSLRELGTGSYATLFEKSRKTLNRMSISTTHCDLSLLPLVLTTLAIILKLKLFLLLSVFAKLVGLTFWWPRYDLDGKEVFLYVHHFNRDKYFYDLCHFAETYITGVRTHWSSWPHVCRLLDGLNMHRLLELHVHTVPRSGHALFVSYLTFEPNHQPPKSTISRNTSKNSHISAVYPILGEAKFRRLHGTWRLTNDKNSLVSIKEGKI